MDWTLAISRNRDALLVIIADLFALAGMRGGNVPERLSRHAYHAICHVLKAAEAAVRRLIFLAARDLVISVRPSRAAPAGLPCVRDAQRLPAFNLIDPLKQFDPASAEDISASLCFISQNAPTLSALSVLAAPTVPESLALCHRLLAIRDALENLPKQARRLARWQARHRLLLKRGPCRVTPFRPGLPPGYRARATHEVDPILLECHRLMRDFTHQPNSS